MLESLNISSPKRTRAQTGWDGFFPYYAGYPVFFARELLRTANLPKDGVVVDPWNGSGTTTYAASVLGLLSRGFDLNPVMAIVARARLLPPSEADSIEPLAKEVLRTGRAEHIDISGDEPLALWFGVRTATTIRSIERSIRQRLIGAMTITPKGTDLEHISGLAAMFYVALFAVCRELAARFRSSNPTWLRRPKEDEARIGITREVIAKRFLDNLRNMAQALEACANLFSAEQGRSEIRLADSTSATLQPASVDFVLTSPPYCTRIDYTAATRIELALLHPLMATSTKELGRRMIGSTRVPRHEIGVSSTWGERCCSFLRAIREHPTKASSGYYYRTHLDYFDKMARSLDNIVTGLKSSAVMVFVVQDSYYKDIHNDLPSIIADMATMRGLELRRRDDFELARTMAGINPRAKAYEKSPGATEAVLCFRKQ